MADTTALKNRIRAAVKANDNQEITGPVLQQALLDMVDELNGATETEASQRQNGDSTLQQGINTERQARIDADSALGQRITEEIQQERQRAEEAFDDLDLIDTAGSQVSPEAIDLTLRKNDGSDQDPDWRTLAELVLPSATALRAGLMSAKDKQKLNNLTDYEILKYKAFIMRNAFDKDDKLIVKGYYRLYTTGVIASNSNYEYTTLFLKPKTLYRLLGIDAGTCHTCFYNNDTYLSGTTANAFTVPANCNKVYLSIQISDEDTFQVICMGNKYDYTPYGILNLDNAFRTGSDKLFLKNILDKNADNIVRGFYCMYTNGAFTQNAPYCIIPLNLPEGKTYTISGGTLSQYHVAFFQFDTYLSGVIAKTFTVPSGCNVVYISPQISELDTLQIELGTIPTQYSEYGKINNDQLILDNSVDSWLDYPEGGSSVRQTNVFYAIDSTRNKPKKITGITFKHDVNTDIQFWKVTLPNYPQAGTDGIKVAITPLMHFSESGETTVPVNTELGEHDFIGVNGTFYYYINQTGGGYASLDTDGSYSAGVYTAGKLGFKLLSYKSDVNSEAISELNTKVSQNTTKIVALETDSVYAERQKHVNTILDIQNLERFDFSKYTNYVASESIYCNLMRHSGKKITDIYYATRGGTTKFYLCSTANGKWSATEEIVSNVEDIRPYTFIAHVKLASPIILGEGQYIGISNNFYYQNSAVLDKAYNSVTIGSNVNYQTDSELGYVCIDETLTSKSILKDEAIELLSPDDFIKNTGTVFADGHTASSNSYRNTGLIDVSAYYRIVASFQGPGIDDAHGQAIILYDSHLNVVKAHYAYAYTRNCFFDIFLEKNVKYMLCNVYYNVNGADYTTFECYAYKRIERKIQQNVLYRKKFNTTIIDSLYLGASAENFTNDGLLINSSTPIQLQKYYSLHTRTLRLLCKFSASTVAKIASNDGYSYIIIDGTAATITMHATTPITKNLSFYNSSHLYLIEITRNYEKNICTITDLNTSDSETIEHVENGTGGAGQGSVGVGESAGAWHDYYQFSATSGLFYIKELSISPLYGKVKTLIYGDSVTELLYYPQADYMKCWVQQFISACANRVMVSPRGGTSIAQVLERIPNELPFIDAEYVMVTIGTNGGVTLDNYSQLIEYIFKCGSTPILNHIPCNINIGEVSNHEYVNGLIDQIRKKYGIHGVDFDIPTSINLDGQDVDTTKMYWEDYGGTTGSVYHHPNVKGSTAMMQQIKLDMPELLI